MSKYTPTPWLRDGRLVYALTPYTGKGPFTKRDPEEVNRFQLWVSSVNGQDGACEQELEANAALIVRAVNSFDAMREALEKARAFVAKRADEEDVPLFEEIQAALKLSEEE